MVIILISHRLENVIQDSLWVYLLEINIIQEIEVPNHFDNISQDIFAHIKLIITIITFR